MSMKECLEDQFKVLKFSKEQKEFIKEAYFKDYDRFVAEGLSDAEAAIKAQEILDNKIKLQEQTVRNQMQHAIKAKQITDKFDKKLSDNVRSHHLVSDLYQAAAYQGENVKAEVLSHINGVAAKKLGGNFFELQKDHGFFRSAILAISKKSDDVQVNKMAEVIQDTFDYLGDRFRAAGGVLGKLENYFPQVHMKEAIQKVSKQEWMEFTKSKLDRSRIVDAETGRVLDDAELDKALSNMYDDVVSDGVAALKRQQDSGKAASKGGGSDLDKKRNRSRFLHFKDAESFIEYNAKFGSGDEGLINSFMSHISSMSKDIGALEKLGPRPDAMAAHLARYMTINDKAASKRRNLVNSEYRLIRGFRDYSGADTIGYKIVTGIQNVLRSAYLGAASLSAISDTAYIGATAKINGLSATKSLGRYFSLLRPGTSEARQLAKNYGYISDAVSGSLLADSKFATEMANSGFTGWLATMTNKLSGLERMTESAQLASMIEGFSTLGMKINDGVKWKELPPTLRESLERFDITDGDWDNLLKAGAFDYNGMKVIIPQELRLNKNLDGKVSADLADKIGIWTQTLGQQATNEATLKTRAITTGAVFGDGSPGSLSRNLAGSLLMFKTFPITVMNTHVIPAIRRAKGGKFDHLMYSAVATTLLGGLAMQLKDIAKGKTTQDAFTDGWTPKYEFWVAALMQGGGLGLFGDFMLGDYSRFGRNPISEAGGPFIGFAEDVFSLTKGNFDKTMTGKEAKNFKRDVFRMMKRTIPLGNLWYTRLFLERTLLDNLERMADPNFDRRIRRIEKRMKKEKGQEFWWKPGKAPRPEKITGE